LQIRSGQASLKPQDYYEIENGAWWSAFTFLHAVINTEATLRIEETRQLLYNFVIRSVHKYALFISQDDTKFQDALIDSIKGLNWITYQATIISKSRFGIVQDLNLTEYDLPIFITPEK